MEDWVAAGRMEDEVAADRIEDGEGRSPLGRIS